MAESLNAIERGYLLDAIGLLDDLGNSAPELRGHCHASFATCHSLCELVAGVGDPDAPEVDLWASRGGEGHLSRAEVIALQELIVALRRVVNGCEAAAPYFRKSLVASVRLAETLIRLGGETGTRGHLEAVTT
jgi:hypothetical protein